MGVFEEIEILIFFLKRPKLFCLYLSNQISLRGRFVFKTNGRISSITSYKDHCCSFFTSWIDTATEMLNFIKSEKTPNFGRMVRTLDYAQKLKLEFSEVDIVWMKIGFWNFEEIPFPWKPRAIRLSLKKGISQRKMLPGTGECHIYGAFQS